MEPSSRIPIGISSCLLGEKVRFDANHKLDSYIVGTLGRWFEFIPICPEVAVGMGVPREPIRLEGDPERPRVVGTLHRDRDFTEPLSAYGSECARRLDALSGYIFKSKSPSCGLWRVKVYQAGGYPARSGRGAYAQAFTEAQPLLPIEEEGRLGDPVLRENFIERVFAYRRWQELMAAGPGARALIEFHAAHKLVLMSHGTEHYRTLGRLMADAGRRDPHQLAGEYLAGFMAALARPATRKRHTNVLQHLAGYLKRALDREDRAELLEIIDAYRIGLVPLVVPITLLKHHFRRHPHEYVERQVYLEPHPPELMLRNGI